MSRIGIDGVVAIFISELGDLTLSHETLHVHTHAQAWRGVLDPNPKVDRYSVWIYP